MESALQHGLIVITAGEEVLRICPPLTITPKEIEAGLEILAESWNALEQVDGD
jgi:4-aminobutyrate aminotransferase-like enzyme